MKYATMLDYFREQIQANELLVSQGQITDQVDLAKTQIRLMAMRHTENALVLLIGLEGGEEQ